MQKTAASRYPADYLRTASRPKPERVGRSRRIARMHPQRPASARHGASVRAVIGSRALGAVQQDFDLVVEAVNRSGQCSMLLCILDA